MPMLAVLETANVNAKFFGRIVIFEALAISCLVLIAVPCLVEAVHVERQNTTDDRPINAIAKTLSTEDSGAFMVPN